MWTIQEEKGKEMKRWERRERIQKKRGMSELLTPRMESVDEKDTRWKREWKGKIKTEPGTRIASRLSLVRPMRFERTTFRVGVWHSIQLSYGHIFSLSIISGICGFCKGKQEKQKNIQNLRKKLLTFCEQGDKINKLSPTGRQRRCTLKIEQHSLEIDREVNGESL